MQLCPLPPAVPLSSGRPECGPVGWRMARSRPGGICCQDSADPLSAASCPGPWHPLLCGLTMTPEAFLGQRTEAGCEVLRPVGDSVAWVRSPRQLLHVGLSTGILGCSSLGCGKPLGAVLCDPHCLPGLHTPCGSMGEVGCFSPFSPPARVFLPRSGPPGDAVPLNLPCGLLRPCPPFWGPCHSPSPTPGFLHVPSAGLSTESQGTGHLSNAVV